MQSGNIWQNPSVRVGATVGFWTLLGLSFASQLYLAGGKAGFNVSWTQAVASSLADWYAFAVLSWPAVRLARMFPFERPFWPGSLLVHLPASVLFSLVYVLLRAALAVGSGWWTHAPIDFVAAVRPLLAKTWYFNLVIYWVIFAVSHAFEYYRKYQERELRAVELERRLAEAKLQALQMQLNPHFLFNTLNAISALMHKDVEAADRMIARLSGLLRQALESSDTQEVPLDRELRFLRDYLVIEQTRFGDRLSVAIDAAPDTLDALVPNLILQPLVENAIIHGLEPQARAGRIRLRSQRDGDFLRLTVQDNGQGFPTADEFEEGIGLSNTRARLHQLYGEGHEFAIQNAPEGGVLVGLTIPFRVADSQTPG